MLGSKAATELNIGYIALNERQLIASPPDACPGQEAAAKQVASASWHFTQCCDQALSALEDHGTDLRQCICQGEHPGSPAAGSTALCLCHDKLTPFQYICWQHIRGDIPTNSARNKRSDVQPTPTASRYLWVQLPASACCCLSCSCNCWPAVFHSMPRPECMKAASDQQRAPALLGPRVRFVKHVDRWSGQVNYFG